MDKLNLSFSLDNGNLSILEEDDNILLTEMYVVSDGDSRPVSLGGKPCITNFSLDGIKDASATLMNKPIVCVWNRWQGDFKNHAYTQQDILARVAIGVVPESCDMDYKEIDGRTFLVCKVAFWKKYFPDEVKRIADNTINHKPTNLSMEISVMEGHYEETQYYIIDKFKFEGISLLGENVGTGIADAQMNTIKFSSVESLDDVIQETNMRFASYNDKEKGEKTKVELTKNQIREILVNALSEYKDEEGYAIYWIADFDSQFIYVENSADGFKPYKAGYVLDAENKTATVDIENKKPVIHGGYVDVVEGEEEPKTYSEALASCKELAAEKVDLESKFAEAEKTNEELTKEKETLEAAKTELEEKNAEFSKVQEEKATLETNFNAVSEELAKLKEETVVKYSRLVELEGLFAKQEEDSLIAKAESVLEEKKAYFSEDERKEMMDDFKKNYLSSENGFATFSTVVSAKAEPRVQAKLNALMEQLNNVKPNDENAVDFSSGAIVENAKPIENLDVWSRLGVKTK